MGNCISDSSEQPGARSLSAFVRAYDREHDPTWQAVKATEQRAEEAEKAAAKMTAALEELNREKTRAALPVASTSRKPSRRRSNIKWRRCPQCSAMVELEDGHKDITSTCEEHWIDGRRARTSLPHQPCIHHFTTML